MTPYILAEIASGHYGSYKTLIDLIYASKESGANGVKLQMWRDSEIKSHKYYHNLKKFEFKDSQWQKAAKLVKELQFDLWVEVYGVQSIKLADQFKYDYLKANRKHADNPDYMALIRSGELTRNYMSTWWRFDPDSGRIQKNIAVGEQSYPTTPAQGWYEADICNQLAEQDTNVMYSCHQNPLGNSAYTIPLAAYQAGADIIEKHICISRKELREYSRDYVSSFEPKEFKDFVNFMKTKKVTALCGHCGLKM